MLAVRAACYDGAKLLIDAGASIQTGGGLLGSALHVGTVNLDTEICKLLLEYVEFQMNDDELLSMNDEEYEEL